MPHSCIIRVVAVYGLLIGFPVTREKFFDGFLLTTPFLTFSNGIRLYERGSFFFGFVSKFAM